MTDGTNFPYKLFLTDTQVSRSRKAFANGSSANITFSKTKMQSAWFFNLLLEATLASMIETQKNDSKKCVLALAGKEKKYYLKRE